MGQRIALFKAGSPGAQHRDGAGRCPAGTYPGDCRVSVGQVTAFSEHGCFGSDVWSGEGEVGETLRGDSWPTKDKPRNSGVRPQITVAHLVAQRPCLNT